MDRAIILAIPDWIELLMLNRHGMDVTQDTDAPLAGKTGEGQLSMATSGRDSFSFAFAYYYFYFTGGALRVREAS
jgi:hypothetical protein